MVHLQKDPLYQATRLWHIYLFSPQYRFTHRVFEQRKHRVSLTIDNRRYSLAVHHVSGTAGALVAMLGGASLAMKSLRNPLRCSGRGRRAKLMGAPRSITLSESSRHYIYVLKADFLCFQIEIEEDCTLCGPSCETCRASNIRHCVIDFCQRPFCSKHRLYAPLPNVRPHGFLILRTISNHKNSPICVTCAYVIGAARH